MYEEVSAGGIVIFGNTILLLKKYNGDWVLPKGKVELNETLEETAVREVYEEASVKVKVISYIGKIHYSYRKNWEEDRLINKTVHWFLMQSRSMDSVPQKEEGFIDAKFVHIDRTADLVKYEDEKKVIEKAIKKYNNLYN